VYSSLAAAVAARGGEVYPFHVGDTWLRPPIGCAVEDGGGPPDTNRYTAVQGWADLLDALRARTAERTGHPVDADALFVCAGATAGLAALTLAMVNPGDEVIICAPAWPLVANMVRIAGGVPVFVDTLTTADDPDAFAAALMDAATDRTIAVYLNTPNNPTGRILPEATLRATAHVAAHRGWWIIADEVYEDLQFEGTHTPMRRFAPDRTISVHSASKAWGMAGYRAGWLVGPPALMREATKLSTYTYFCAPWPAQVALLRALGPLGTAWQADARAAYHGLGTELAAKLGATAPSGGTFLFLDVRRQVDALGGLPALLFRAAEQGLLLAPGTSFGPYPGYLRMCFTAVEPDITRRGVDKLATLLA
jgi:N-succinyldiaminopimelate aminotransferase